MTGSRVLWSFAFVLQLCRSLEIKQPVTLWDLATAFPRILHLSFVYHVKTSCSDRCSVITFLTLSKENELFQGRWTPVNTSGVRLCITSPDRNLPNGYSRHSRHLCLVCSVFVTVLHWVKEEGSIPPAVNKRKTNWIGDFCVGTAFYNTLLKERWREW